MVFSSIPFLFFFLPLCLIFYYVVPFKFKNFILLIFSLIFYAWGEPIYVFLMIFSCIINYYFSKSIEKYPNKRKLILILSIVINLLILGFFKYANFLIDNLNLIFNINIESLSLSLPIGISFFTFQTMSYVIDVYRKEVKASKSLINFMAYVSMFPQLIAGPIVRYETIEKELNKRTIHFENYSKGMMRFLDGLFKKVIIANSVGYLWNIISVSSNSVLTSWLGLVCFTLQIYFDFSGYSDMAIGMGKMLGFNYLENFNYPYIAKSITDFWRRWHISLSSFFRDYVYIPLGGSRCSKVINIRNILIVWILTGIWHGAAWNFIIWGLYFGILLIVEKYLLKNKLEKLPNCLRHIYALSLIMIGWLIFAFDNTNHLLDYAKMLVGINTQFIDNNFLFYIKNYGVIIILGICFTFPLYPHLKEKLKNNKFWKILLIIIYLSLFIITVSLLVGDTYNPFLYFRF